MPSCSIGQTKPVHVYQLIAEDTVESKVRQNGNGAFCSVHFALQVLDIQEKKKKLIQQVRISMQCGIHVLNLC